MIARIALTEPRTNRPTPITPRISARATYGERLEGQPVDEPLERPGDVRVAVELAQGEGPAEREAELADEHDEQPALEADPRPASQRRRFTPGRAPDGRPTPARRARSQPGGELLGDDDRAVVAAGAADGDRQAGLALRLVGRQREVEEVVEERDEPAGDRLVEHERAHRLREPGQLAQLGDVVRVLHEPDVEDEVGLQRDAVLEAEADQLDDELVRLDVILEVAEEPLAQLAQRQVGGVEDDVRLGRGPVSSRRRSSAIELAIPLLVAQRMAVARLGEAPDEDLVTRLEEEDLGPDPATLEGAAHRGRTRAATSPDRTSRTMATRAKRDGSLETSSARSGSSSPGRLSTTV